MLFDTFSFFHNESGRDDQTHLTDRIMKKTGLCSSGGKGSQGNGGMAESVDAPDLKSVGT